MSVSSKNIKPKGGSVKTSSTLKTEEKGPAVVEERVEPVEYMPQPIVKFYQDAVDDMLGNSNKYNESDQSEIWERLGVAQFFFGIYRQAAVSLQKAFDLRKKLKYTRSSARIALMLGICHYRVGLLDQALVALETVVKNAAKSFPDLCASAYGNMALSYMSSGKMKEAVDNGKKGLELALKVAQGNKGAERVLQSTRILVNAYIKINDVAKAEVLIFTFGFSKSEQALLKAGVKFAAGLLEDANNLIDVFLDEKRADDRLGAEKEEKQRARTAEEVARKTLLLSRATTPEGATAEGAEPLDDESSVGGDSVGTAGSKASKSRKRRSGGAAGAKEEKHEVASYHSGVLSEDDDSEEETVAEEVDTRSQKEKWAEADKREAAMKAMKRKGEAERRLDSYTTNKRKLDGLLAEAKCVYNLSVLASRKYSHKQALKTLDLAEATIQKYLSLQQEIRTAEKKEDVQAMAQFFQDADLNVTPLCETVETSAEPYLVLSHIYYAKGEAHMLLANQAKRDGLAVSAGGVLNRALPTVSNGNDFDPYDTSRSQAYDEQYMDPHAAAAREYFAKSESIMEETNLSRDIVTFETTREIEQDPTAEKKLDEDGNEIYQPPVTETFSTTLKPVDISIATVQHEAYGGLLDVLAGGPVHYKKATDIAMKELRLQYGVKLTERGTKGHQNSRVDYKNQYVSTVHDPVSIRAELLPLVTRLGREDVALWVEWCLSASGGLGMGVFGTSFQMPINKAQLQKEMAEKAMEALGGAATASLSGSDDASVTSASKNEGIFKSLDSSVTIGSTTAFPSLKPAARPTDAFLKEVRSRLSEVEGALSSRHDSAEATYKPRDKELRMLINICLARVTAQLKQKRDCELAIDMMEELAKDMRHRTQNKYDGFYIALSCRYRLEIEESKVASGMSAEAMGAKLVELLVFAKEYINATEACALPAEQRKKQGELGPDQATADLMLRDAYKKCINLYVDLSTCPIPEAQLKKQKEVEERGTVDMLATYGDAEVEEIEESGDMAFFRKFGKIRAQQLFRKMQGCKGK